jgi:D-serine deaminase-like pyridoxal phosphate-dependent protein
MTINAIQIQNNSKRIEKIIGAVAALFGGLLFYQDYCRRQGMSERAEADRRRDYLYYKQAFEGVAMPFAFLDLDLLDDNIRQIVSRCGEKSIRLASKSLRSVAVIKHILEADVRFQGVMCFTAPEALYLAKRGLDHHGAVDLLVGYPVWEPRHIEAVAEATQAGKHITLMVDSLAHVQHIAKIARQKEVRLPLCLDIDMSTDFPALDFALSHSPIKTQAHALDVVKRIADSKYVWLDGLMGYEAQIAGVGDHYLGQRFKKNLIKLLKRRSVPKVTQRRAELVEAIQALGLSLRFVNGGGTGSMSTTCNEPTVTEVTVGSAFYAPVLFDYYSDFRYQPAAGFAIEVVQQPTPDIYTCLGGGYVASGSAGKDAPQGYSSSKIPQPYLPREAELLPLEGAGEVQTPIRYTGQQKLSLGDPIFMRHSKAGELCERFNHLLLLEDGEVVDEVTTYRGDGQCFL